MEKIILPLLNLAVTEDYHNKVKPKNMSKSIFA